MNDQELADALVETGIVEGPNNYAAYALLDQAVSNWQPAKSLVNDWSVAGACMEKCVGKPEWLEITINRKCRGTPDDVARCWIQDQCELDDPIHARDRSLPRAIIEAYVEAMK